MASMVARESRTTSPRAFVRDLREVITRSWHTIGFRIHDLSSHLLFAFALIFPFAINQQVRRRHNKNGQQH